MKITTKRIYDKPASSDGYRVLVDRVWPRGMKKEAARVDRWLKGIAPSPELRKWFGHDPKKWPEFKRRYFKELEASPEDVEELRAKARDQNVCLLFAAKDEAHNNAVALQEFLQEQSEK